MSTCFCDPPHRQMTLASNIRSLDICLDLQQKFGFQRESMRNVVRAGTASTMRPLTTDIATNFIGSKLWQ